MSIDGIESRVSDRFLTLRWSFTRFELELVKKCRRPTECVNSEV